MRELYFEDRDDWRSLRQSKCERIRLKVVPPSENVLDFSAPLLDSPAVPQADDVLRIQQMAELVKKGMRDSASIAAHYGFTRRQSSYYRDAVQTLGLLRLDEGTNEYHLTRDGNLYLQMQPQGRADHLARRMTRLPVMRHVLERMAEAGKQGLDEKDLGPMIEQYAKAHGLRVNATTANRRRSTIRAWLAFIATRTGAIVRTKDRRWHVHGSAPRSLDDYV